MCQPASSRKRACPVAPHAQLENLDPLMGFQPTTRVGEESSRGVDLVERRSRVTVELSDRRPIKRLNDANHR